MCRFKSGLILKNRCVVAKGADDSHSNLLESLGIEDTRENAMRKFVRVELTPVNDEWWTNPDTWKIDVDQDIVPDWFDIDREKYFEEFRNDVKIWWQEHIRVGQKIDELSSGYYRLKRCKVKKLLNDVQAMLDSSTVQAMLGNSTVQKMCGNSTVQAMCDNSTVQEMLGNSTVQEMWGNSTVQKMLGNSTVQKMLGNSTVQEMWGNSTVQAMLGNSIARDCHNQKVRISSSCDYEIVKHENKEE